MAAGHEKSTWNNIFSLLYSKTRVSPSVDMPLQAAWFLPDIVEDAARSNAWVAYALQASGLVAAPEAPGRQVSEHTAELSLR